MSAFCVILRPSLGEQLHPRTKRCYLRAGSADRAIVAASEDNPDWQPIGIEPSGLFAFSPQAETLGSNTSHAA
jgi:hypothetical protein